MLFSAALAIGSSVYSAHESNRATKAQTKGAEKAADAEIHGYKQGLERIDQGTATARDDLSRATESATGGMEPYNQGGIRALNLLIDGITRGVDLSKIPGFEEAVAEGIKGAQAGQAARGGLLSGAGIRELHRGSMGVAGKYYNDYLDRLIRISSQGQSAAAQQGAFGMQGGTGLANLSVNGAGRGALLLGQMGQARAGQYVNQGNARAEGHIRNSNIAQNTAGNLDYLWQRSQAEAMKAMAGAGGAPTGGVPPGGVPPAPEVYTA